MTKLIRTQKSEVKDKPLIFTRILLLKHMFFGMITEQIFYNFSKIIPVLILSMFFYADIVNCYGHD